MTVLIGLVMSILLFTSDYIYIYIYIYDYSITILKWLQVSFSSVNYTKACPIYEGQRIWFH